MCCEVACAFLDGEFPLSMGPKAPSSGSTLTGKSHSMACWDEHRAEKGIDSHSSGLRFF